MSGTRTNENEVIEISPENALKYAWLLDFFEDAEQGRKRYWRSNELYQFNGQSFKFSQPVLARSKKKDAGKFSYEMINYKERLGSGVFGAVFKISRTISRSQAGEYRVRQKNRIVKYQRSRFAAYEFAQSKSAPHLHAKPPTAEFMVMRHLPGATLSTFLEKNKLSPQDKLALTIAIVQTIENQLVNIKIKHRDLHGGNILVKVIESPEKNPFDINIIDYGWALADNSVSFTTPSHDLQTLMQKTSYLLWNPKQTLPSAITALFDDKNSLEECLTGLTYCGFAKTPEAQYQVDLYFEYLCKISKNHQALANELKDLMLAAIAQSDTDNMTAMMNAVKTAENRSQEIKDGPSFPRIAFNTEPKVQLAFNQIHQNIALLDGKAQRLIKSGHEKEGNHLLSVTQALRKNTLKIYQSDAQTRVQAAKDCKKICKKALRSNESGLNIHGSHGYIFAEIAIILACLIVLYPIVAGINYCFTKHFGIFTQTTSAKIAHQTVQLYKSLTPSG